jgi:uncharacterized membrane protein
MKKPDLIQRVRAVHVRLDWFMVFFAFLICAFLGWVFETSVVWRETGKFTDRGYLMSVAALGRYFPVLRDTPLIGNFPVVFGLPIIEMYGFGGVIILATFRHMRNHPVRIFFSGTVLLTLFELVSSYFCSYVLRHDYWSYASDLLNFQGRICLRSSIAWGMLSVVTIEVLHPFLEELYAHERRRKYFKVVVTLLMVYAVICGALKYWLDPGLFPS